MVRDALAGRWDRHRLHPGIAGARQHQDDRALHARDAAGVGADQESAGQHAIVGVGWRVAPGWLPDTELAGNTTHEGVIPTVLCRGT